MLRLRSHGRVMVGHETPLQALIVLPSLGFCGNSFLPSGRSLFPFFVLSWISLPAQIWAWKWARSAVRAPFFSISFSIGLSVFLPAFICNLFFFCCCSVWIFYIMQLHYFTIKLASCCTYVILPNMHTCGNIIMLVSWTGSFLIHDIQVNSSYLFQNFIDKDRLWTVWVSFLLCVSVCVCTDLQVCQVSGGQHCLSAIYSFCLSFLYLPVLFLSFTFSCHLRCVVNRQRLLVCFYCFLWLFPSCFIRTDTLSSHHSSACHVRSLWMNPGPDQKKCQSLKI